jgi:hypothetical protein
LRIDNVTTLRQLVVTVDNSSVEALRNRAAARGIPLPVSVSSQVVASLKIGKHLLLFGPTAEICEAVAELVADEAADRGLSFGTLIFSSTTASLIPLHDVLSERHGADFWVILRRADPISLRRLVDELRGESNVKRRLLAVTTRGPGLVLRDLSAAARRELAIIDISTH